MERDKCDDPDVVKIANAKGTVRTYGNLKEKAQITMLFVWKFDCRLETRYTAMRKRTNSVTICSTTIISNRIY